MSKVAKISEKGTTTCCRTLAVMATLFCAAAPAFADTYAYKVQYLQSSGAQYINTGVVPTSNTMVRVKYEYLAANGSYDMIAGCTSQRYYPVSLSSKDPLRERHVYNGSAPADIQTVLTSHTVVFNDAQHRVFKDGRLVTTFDQTFTSTRPCYLFASNNGGTANYFSTARIYWCEFVDSSTDVVLRRFIPVVDENDRPAMFDEIGETLYYNLGSGDDLTAGQRVETPWYFVEYLESDGNQWIDTGLYATSKVETAVGYKFTAETQTSLAMICGSQSASRYYPVSLNNKSGRAERYVFGDSSPTQTHPALQHHEIVFNDGVGNVFNDGKFIETIPATQITKFGAATAPIYLFATSQTGPKAGYQSKARIYHCEIYDDGVLKRAFSPAVMKDANGDPVPCMYERCGETNHYNKGTGTFKVGRIISHEVVLDLSARNDLAAGLKVLSFEERPSYGTVFTLDAATAAVYDATVGVDGVYLATKGTGGDAARIIAVTGSTTAQFATNAMPACASVVLHGAITLASDCDWTGLGTLVIPDGVTIDLNGHDLHLSGFTCLPGSVVTITDSTDGKGELHVTVAENDVLMNDRVLLEGSMRLVKHGAGVFVAAKMNQTYTGGTDVDGGFLRVSNKDLTNGYRGELGDKYSDVRIGAGAELLINGYYNQEFTYTFDGGTFASGADPKNVWRQISDRVVFTADGTVTGHNQAFMVGGYAPSTITMNGNTLHVNLDTGKEFSICNATFAGEGVLEGLSGWIKPYSHPCVGTNLTLRFPTETGGLWLDKNFTVSNFVSHSVNYNKGGDSTALTVLGTFTPAEGGRTAFPNTILADGSTLDLSQMDDIPTFRTTCSQVDGKTTHTRTISFADTATINVKLGPRKISHDVPIVGWTEPPSNLASLTFKAVDRGRNYSISKRSDGLYLTCGLMIIVR